LPVSPSQAPSAMSFKMSFSSLTLGLLLPLQFQHHPVRRLAPVLVDGRLLVDGGLTGNLAVNVMQDMNVDVIIAVDVEFPLYKMDELDSAIAISEQVFT